MSFLLFGLIGCWLVEEPVVLESVHDAPASQAKRLGVRGVAHPEAYGVYRKHTLSRDVRFRQEVRYVVVPVLEPGETLPDAVVHLWLTHHRFLGEKKANEPFFERAREMFDGKRQNVLRRLNTNPDAAWNQAVRDAVQRHGLRSHPDAVVVGLGSDDE